MGDYFRRILSALCYLRLLSVMVNKKEIKGQHTLNKTKKMESHLIDIRGITYISASCFGKS